jgi:hypothetical protein
MKYSRLANGINVLFILGIYIAPIGYCLSDHSIPTDVGRTVIVLSFALGAFAIADWYYMYMTNSFNGIAWAIALGALVAVGALLIASVASGASVADLALFHSVEIWDGQRISLRAYVAGVGVVAVALVSVPRLLLIRSLSPQPLPVKHDA